MDATLIKAPACLPMWMPVLCDSPVTKPSKISSLYSYKLNCTCLNSVCYVCAFLFVVYHVIPELKRLVWCPHHIKSYQLNSHQLTIRNLLFSKKRNLSVSMTTYPIVLASESVHGQVRDCMYITCRNAMIWQAPIWLAYCYATSVSQCAIDLNRSAMKECLPSTQEATVAKVRI